MWELVWEDEVLEGNRKTCLRVKPAIRNDGDVVVGRDRFKHGHRDSDTVLVLRIPLAKNEGVVEQYYLAVNIFDDNPEGFRSAMDFLIPTEIRNDGQVYP